MNTASVNQKPLRLPSSSLEEYIEDFLLYLQTNNYSVKTVYNYERDLKSFVFFLNDIDQRFELCNKKTILLYKAYLNSVDRKTPLMRSSKKRLRGTSLNRTLSALRALLTYLVNQDIPTPVAPEAVQLTKTIKKHPQVAEFNDLVRLVEAPSLFEHSRAVSLRNRAMLETLFSTGMRISELIQLNKIHIDPTGKIFIQGKGKKERFVYLTPRAYKCINEYLSLRTDSAPALFIPYRGKNTKVNSGFKRRVSSNYLQERIKYYREKLRINVPTSAHSLRHGFATYLAENGANPAAIQILLGHESLDTTTRYVHTSDQYAEETHRKFHPLREK